MTKRDVMTALEPEHREAVALFAQGCGISKNRSVLKIFRMAKF